MINSLKTECNSTRRVRLSLISHQNYGGGDNYGDDDKLLDMEGVYHDDLFFIYLFKKQIWE